jgi:hypothetical protein
LHVILICGKKKYLNVEEGWLEIGKLSEGRRKKGVAKEGRREGGNDQCMVYASLEMSQ